MEVVRRLLSHEHVVADLEVVDGDFPVADGSCSTGALGSRRWSHYSATNCASWTTSPMRSRRSGELRTTRCALRRLCSIREAMVSRSTCSISMALRRGGAGTMSCSPMGTHTRPNFGDPDGVGHRLSAAF